MRRPFALLAVLALVATAPLAAQQRHEMHSQDRQQQEAHGDMQMMSNLGAFAPKALLEQREALNLTDAQVSQLTTLADEAKSTHDEAMATHEEHRQALHTALMSETPDEDPILSHMAAAHAAMGLAHQGEMRAALRAMALLTGEQRDAVSERTMACCQRMERRGH